MNFMRLDGMTTQSQRLKQARLDAGLTQKQVAEAVGIKQPSYSYFEKHDDAGSSHIADIAAVLGVSAYWLRTGKEEPKGDLAVKKLLENSNQSLLNEHEDAENKIWIDIVNIRFSCGTGESIEFHFDEVIGRMSFEASLFHRKGVKPENAKLAQALGDSMEPYVCAYDVFMIDLADTDIRDGEMYAVYFEGEAMLKQIFKEEGGTLVLHSLNEKYRDKRVTPQNGTSFRVIGRQFWRGG